VSVVAAGRGARARVLAFIRRHLPAGSPDAFTETEIAELERHKQSSAAFVPY
jgi:hypothetical protein